MKITINIEDKIVRDAMALTGEKKKGPAISKAASEFVRRQMVKKFATMVMEGEFSDYPMTNEELKTLDR